MSSAAVVLAAGASRRLGRPKQQVVLAGETLLARAVRIAREAALSPVIVVTRASLQPDGFDREDVFVVVNDHPEEGIASSIRCGIEFACGRQVTGTVIMACDHPALRTMHLLELVSVPSRLTASAYSNCLGIPAYFPEAFFADLLRLRGDTGARSLLKTAHAVPAEELQLDIDTEEDLKTARHLLETSARR